VQLRFRCTATNVPAILPAIRFYYDGKHGPMLPGTLRPDRTLPFRAISHRPRIRKKKKNVNRMPIRTGPVATGSHPALRVIQGPVS